jgi:site-specific recombinase XerD
MSTEYIENDLLCDWIQSKDKKNDSWQATCRRAGVLFFDFLDKEDIEPEDIEFNKKDIEDYKEYVEDETDLAGNTIKNYCMASRDLIQYAYADRRGWNAIFEKGNPLSIYEAEITPEQSNWEAETGEDIAYIRQEEHEALLDENSNPRDDILLRTLWDTGCRPAELRRLKVEDVDTQELIRNRKINVDTAKRDNHDRDLFLSPTTRQRWARWLLKGGRKAYSTHSYDSDYVFLTKRSPKMDKSTVNLQIKRLAKRANIQEVGYTQETDQLLRGEYETVEREYVRINAKSYRSAFIVRACRNGINLDLLTELTGHASADSLDAYTRYLPDDIEEAWERFIH